MNSRGKDMSVNISLLMHEVASFLIQNNWIFLGLSILLCVDVLFIVHKKNKQSNRENDITSMFNEDGSRNEHLEHRDYNLTTPLFFLFISVVIYAISISL